MRRFASLLLPACLAALLCLAGQALAQPASPVGESATPSRLSDEEMNEFFTQFFGKPLERAQPQPAPRGWVGLIITPAGENGQGTAGYTGPGGVLVQGVELGAPGDAAGLEPGDVLTLPDNGPLTVSGLAAMVSDTAPGGKFALERWRQGQVQAVTVAPVKPPVGVKRQPGKGLAGLAAGVGFTRESQAVAERLAALLRAKGLHVRMVRYAAGPLGIPARHEGRLFVAQGFEAEGKKAAALVKPVQTFAVEPAVGDYDVGPHFTFWPTR